jgi:uncharacterized protein YjbI with pentapeptide repeats
MSAFRGKAGRVTDLAGENLTGSRFEDVYLSDARLHDVDLTNARFHLLDLTGGMIRGAALVNVDISGEIKNLRVNGVDVVLLVGAELNGRYLDRVKMRPTGRGSERTALGEQEAVLVRIRRCPAAVPASCQRATGAWRPGARTALPRTAACAS